MKAAKSFSCCTKGEWYEKEEYGAFDNAYNLAIECDYDFTNIDIDGNDEFTNKTFNDVDEIVVCGIAGEYCVYETLKNIINHISVDKVKVYLDGIVSIDGGEKLNSFIKENNVKIKKDFHK